MWNYQNNHKIGYHKMKNKQYDTVETDPKSHSIIVERVNKSNKKISELRAILQRESQNS